MKTKILSLLISLSLLACSERENNPTNVRSTLSRAEALMTQAPDSALMLLEDLSKGALRGRENRAHFALLYSQALDKNYIDRSNDSIIRVAVDYYSTRKDNNRKMLAYYYLGRVQYNAKEYQKAIVSLMQAEEAAKLSRDNFYLGLIYRSMSEIHCDIYSFTEALQYARNSYSSFTLSDNQRYADWSLWSLSRAFHNSAQYDSSIVYSKQVINLAQARQDNVLLGDALRLLGNSYATNRQYEDAIQVFNQLIDLGTTPLTASNYFLLGLSYLKTGKTNEANQCMKILSTLDSSHKWLSYEIKRHNQEYTSALEALEHEVNAINQKFSKLINQNVTQATNDYFRYENQLQEKDLQQARLSKIFLIICILFCLVFIVLAGHVVKQKIKLRDEEIEKNIIIASQLRNMLKASQNENQELQNALDGLFDQHFATIDKLSSTYYEMHAAKNEKEAIYKKVKKEIENFSSDMKTLQELENIVNEHKNNVMA
ncbi:MAG: tetratricopeptide repeat protein, partial [Bacteroidales bacterium]|nr:tetratricopeptide repeat protein [Bacteroidales bacterium]